MLAAQAWMRDARLCGAQSGGNGSRLKGGGGSSCSGGTLRARACLYGRHALRMSVWPAIGASDAAATPGAVDSKRPLTAVQR